MNSLASSPVLAWLLSYLFNALWQIPLVLIAASTAARMLRRVNPRAEHRLWVAGLLLQIALPACNLRIPSVRLADFWHMLLGFFSSSNVAGAGGIRIALDPATATTGTLRLPFVLEAAIVLAWACCLLYFAGRLAWGLRQTHALARTATRIALPDDTTNRVPQYCRRLGITAPPPEIAVSSDGIGPITVGLRRGLILLPRAFVGQIAAADLDAVLAHELAHVARRDFAKNLFYGLVSMPVAWHPLMWHTRARVAESRELVCDAIAAGAIATGAASEAAAAARKHYARSLLRIASMLAARPPLATLHALGILGLNPHSNTFERRIMILTRKPESIGTQRRILIAAACGAIAVTACVSALALHTPVAANLSLAATAVPAKVNVDPKIMSGQRIAGENPTYPPEARAKKIQGPVVLEAIIDKDGAIKDLRVLKSPGTLLSDSAMTAVRTWRWRPYLLNGEPVEVETTVRVTYNLGG